MLNANMNMTSSPPVRWSALVTLLVIGFSLSLQAEEKKGLKRIFGKKDAETLIQADTASGPTVVEVESTLASATPQTVSGTDQYPALLTREFKPTRSEEELNEHIDEIYSEYEKYVSNLTAADLQLDSIRSLPPVPSDFNAPWSSNIRRPIYDDRQLRQDLIQVYGTALQHSNAVKVFSELPLIRETAIQEAMGDYDWRAFGELQISHTDEPTSSELTTGFTGRFLEDLGQLNYGVRKRVASGAEVTLSNRLNTLDSNSTFLDPNPQTASEMVLSIVQPLGRGSGIAYNRARIKVAKLDAELASAEYIRSLESHLLEVNRAYWQVYLARAAFLQKKSLVSETSGIVGDLSERGDVDTGATKSALLRAQSSLAQRQASLIRGEMAVRNAEERLRALVNDPDFQMGSGGEFIPLTRPVVNRPISDVQSTARAALYHRPEIVQGFNQLRAAGIRRDIQKNEMKPQLNVVAEVRKSGNDANRDLGGAYSDSFRHGTGWLAGMTFESSLERNLELARYKRREYELRQQTHQLRSTIDQVLLESVVTYRELMTAYRDMQGRWQAVRASREEVRELKERLDVDTDDQNTVGNQLQLILDAIERNQVAEESFLVSIVSYNTAFAAVERAKGTLLEYYDVDISRQRLDGWQRHRKALEQIKAGMGSVEHDIVMNEADPSWTRHRQALEKLKSDRGQQ